MTRCYLTVKLTLKVCSAKSLPDTLIVAVYVPGSSPCAGLMVKLRLPFIGMVVSVYVGAVDSSKSVSLVTALVGMISIINSPVAVLPVFVTVTDSAGRWL